MPRLVENQWLFRFAQNLKLRTKRAQFRSTRNLGTVENNRGTGPFDKPLLYCSRGVLTVRCMAGGSCGLSSGQSWNEEARLRRDTWPPGRRRRTMMKAADTPAITVAAVSAPTTRPTNRLPLPPSISMCSRFFVCCGRPKTEDKTSLKLFVPIEITNSWIKFVLDEQCKERVFIFKKTGKKCTSFT